MERTVVIGAGPAGLTAAYELAEHGLPAIILEKDDQVGGIARTVSYRGYRFDIGGHRFFTKVPLIEKLWKEMLGEDLLLRPRLSRIYYRDRFFDYPLKPLNALRGLGALEAMRILASYARARLFPIAEERSFEHWVTNRFGRRLFEIFFRTYTEKVWGIPCSEIGAEWAAQRIKNLDLKEAVKRALLGTASGRDGVIATLIDQFRYPRLGPGMMWDRWQARLADRGIETLLGADVIQLRHVDGRVVEAVVQRRGGGRERIVGDQFISTMPLRDLVRALEPPPPESVRLAAERLRYRDFLTVVLIVDEADLFPDNWIYIHSPDVRVGRVQNFKNWSPEMVPDPTRTSLGLEYFVQEGDEMWSLPDSELIELGALEMVALGLIRAGTVLDGTVVRMRNAYPVYDPHYQETLSRIRDFASGMKNLQLVGRNGQHRYNNQDHSMLTGIYAARNIAGEDHDVWTVNVEEEYHEGRTTREVPGGSCAGAGGRLTPSRVPERSLEDLLRAAFARYDPVALGIAIGAVCGIGLFIATAIVVLRGTGDPGQALSLLGQYLLGYQVSWGGAFEALLAGFGGGYGFGYVLAKLVNLLIGWHETLLERELLIGSTIDPLEGETT
ncbi:MAG TPA: NAD(P)/FAD-dependent oxidoreductase [Gemmatimonadota bacterium]|nr:NAD(P)/FAD-dependent oxidoreductase [Gemmatimonadota bacterium]